MDFIALINYIGDVLYLIFFTVFTKLVAVYWYLTKKYYFHHAHIEVKVRKWGISITGWNHEQYLIHKKQELLKLKKKLSIFDYLERIFKECKHCNVLTFDCGHRRKLLQFWLGDNSLLCTWTIAKNNDLQYYTYGMLGVLNEIGITKNTESKRVPRKASSHYCHLKFDDLESYSFNFGKDITTASYFTFRIFNDIFRQDISKLRFDIR